MFVFFTAGSLTPSTSRPVSPCVAFSTASGTAGGGSVVGYGGDSVRSDDEKANYELKEMLSMSMESRHKSESEKMVSVV